ncbi:MAG: helicase-associated domain-containing protein [Microbacterium sp.]
MSDAEVTSALTARRIAPQVGWHTFFDAAEALLAPESVVSALSELPAGTLVALSTSTPLAPAGAAALLVDDEGLPLAATAAALAQLDVADVTAPAPRPADEAQEAMAAERTFTTLGALADLLLACLDTPLARVGGTRSAIADEGGSVGVADRKRLLQQRIAQDADELDDLVALAERCGLLRPDGRSWLASPEGSAWVRHSTADRWCELVQRWRAALPDGLSDTSGRLLPVSAWPSAYPLSASWPDACARFLREAEMLALVAAGGAEPAWAAVLHEGGEPDPSALLALLPSEVDRIYLQNDLTAISPGPLAPALDVRLRTMARRESHAQASTYRFTETALEGAVAAGETDETIREFLTSISLTGIPQPLSYLLTRTAERHGLVQVAEEPQTGQTIVTSADAHLLETISVDQALRMLGLTPDAGLLRSRATRHAVYWALADAHYPVIAVDDHGEAQSLDRLSEAAAAEQTNPYAGLLTRLRDAQNDDPEAAWRERELDTAVRAKASIVVEVAMPDGTVRELRLEATGLGGGRLRGLDRAGDVERTLPVSLIRSVRPA